MENQEHENVNMEDASAEEVLSEESSPLEISAETSEELVPVTDGDASLEDAPAKTDTEEPTEAFEAEAPSEAVAEVAAGAVATGIVIKKAHLILGIVIAVALIIGGFLFGFFLSRDEESGLRVDPNAQNYGNVQGFPENTTTDGISVPGYSKVVFPANETDVKMVLLNPEGNPCYFRFTLTLTQTGEVLAQTNLVPPGMAVTDLTLSRKLEAGEYELEILIESFSLDQGFTPMNGAKVNTVLYVR
ncbi:MAG: hypothetical protein IJX28_00415 [Clostridia bacterium]|nr:hypothetical protein [Clostridia bacterium]